MSHTFHIPHRFHPGYSLLGRYVRHRAADRHQAGALFVVALCVLATGLLLGQLLLWGFLAPTLRASPGGMLYFWGAQVGLWLLFGATSLVGVQPRIEVNCTPEALHLRKGARTLTLPAAAVTSVETISALRFHRHEQRYAATHVYVNRPPDELLLLRTAEGPVVIGLAPTDRHALQALLSDRHTTPASVCAP